MRFLNSTLGFLTLCAIIFYATLAAMEIDWAIIKAEVLNASISAWNKLWAEGVEFLPLLPALGWVLAVLVGIMLLGVFFSLLGGMAFSAFRRGAAAKAAVTAPARRWWQAKPKVEEKELFDLIADLTGLGPIRTWDEALAVLRRYTSAAQGMTDILATLDKRFIAHRGRAASHNHVLALMIDIIRSKRRYMGELPPDLTTAPPVASAAAPITRPPRFQRVRKGWHWLKSWIPQVSRPKPTAPVVTQPPAAPAASSTVPPAKKVRVKRQTQSAATPTAPAAASPSAPETVAPVPETEASAPVATTTVAAGGSATVTVEVSTTPPPLKEAAATAVSDENFLIQTQERIREALAQNAAPMGDRSGKGPRRRGFKDRFGETDFSAK